MIEIILAVVLGGIFFRGLYIGLKAGLVDECPPEKAERGNR